MVEYSSQVKQIGIKKLESTGKSKYLHMFVIFDVLMSIMRIKAKSIIIIKSIKMLFTIIYHFHISFPPLLNII